MKRKRKKEKKITERVCFHKTNRRFLQHNRLLIIAPNTFQVEQPHIFLLPASAVRRHRFQQTEKQERNNDNNNKKNTTIPDDERESTQFTFNFRLNVLFFPAPTERKRMKRDCFFFTVVMKR